MSINRAITTIALAGSCTAAAAQSINITADVTSISFGGTVNWTISVTGLTAGQFVQAYDFNINATYNAGTASTFDTSLSTLVGPTAGTPSGASILGASGGQSSLIDPLNATFGDVVLGTFSMVYSAEGNLSYTVTDGGNLSTPIIRVRQGSDFGAIELEGDDFAIYSDCIKIPAPSTLAALALAAAITPRRRRTPCAP